MFGKDLRMLIRGYAVGVKYSGCDVQKLSAEYERGRQAERGPIVHESVLLYPLLTDRLRRFGQQPSRPCKVVCI